MGTAGQGCAACAAVGIDLTAISSGVSCGTLYTTTVEHGVTAMKCVMSQLGNIVYHDSGTWRNSYESYHAAATEHIIVQL
jgi:hypothetical protein